MSRPELETCAVVGVGLVGGSLGMALRASGRTVLGLDLAETLLAQAVACGAIDRGTLDPAELASADLVVVAVPPMRVAETVRAIAPHLKSRAVVVDVASVKGSVVTDVEAAAHAGIHFVGSHPMFGSEGHGVGSARAELVRGAAWIFTPTASTDPGALAALERLARELDMRPVRLEPAEHDRQLGALSHLPYLISVALTRTAPGFQVAGPAFREMSRVAASPTALWREILALNGKATRQAVDRFCAELQRISLLEGDVLADALEEARARRSTAFPPQP